MRAPPRSVLPPELAMESAYEYGTGEHTYVTDPAVYERNQNVLVASDRTYRGSYGQLCQSKGARIAGRKWEILEKFACQS